MMLSIVLIVYLCVWFARKNMWQMLKMKQLKMLNLFQCDRVEWIFINAHTHAHLYMNVLDIQMQLQWH